MTGKSYSTVTLPVMWLLKYSCTVTHCCRYFSSPTIWYQEIGSRLFHVHCGQLLIWWSLTKSLLFPTIFLPHISHHIFLICCTLFVTEKVCDDQHLLHNGIGMELCSFFVFLIVFLDCFLDSNQVSKAWRGKGYV